MVTTYFKNLIANHVWHTEAETTLPTKYYLAMSTTEPLENGTGVTEPDTSSGYARIELTGLANAVNGVVKNSNSLAWDELATDQGVLCYWALFDAVTGGNLLMGNALTSKHLDAGTEIKISPEKLTLSVLGA
ncbi:MAG: hypothetical protein ACI3XJ_12680 [Oscillospiraceae bacterium]